MKVVRDARDCTGAVSVVTIGAFDGVHLGHRALLALLRTEGDARGIPTALVTFDRHPAEVVRPESVPPLLTTLEQKLELLDATGLLDVAVVVTFDEARSRESASDFVTELLAGCLQARLVVVGADFHFGRARVGNVSLLAVEGKRHGFEVVGLPLVTEANSTVAYSSTEIRKLLGAGQVEEAAVLLGRPHEVRGVVRAGARRGRELGFPTLNVDVAPAMCLPAAGIYAGTVTLADGVERQAALSLGYRPTFYDGGHRLLEAYVLDWSGDAYGQQAAVRFVSWIRGELKFESADALVAEITRDVEAVRLALGQEPLW